MSLVIYVRSDSYAVTAYMENYMFVIVRYAEKERIREEYHKIEYCDITIDDIDLCDGDPVELFKVKLTKFDGTVKYCRGVSDIEVI